MTALKHEAEVFHNQYTLSKTKPKP